MPLRAKVEDKEIISTFLSKEEWNDLKDYIKINNIDVVISQTNGKGFLRTSKLGLQHFVHKKGESHQNWKSETQQQLLAKSEIMLACRESGWKAISELVSDNWTTDVFAVKDSIKIAFQVKLSKQLYKTITEQQNKFKIDNIRSCWLVKTPPKEIRDWDNQIIASKEIPIFRITENENKKMIVNVNGINFPLREFVIKLLNGNFKFCNILQSKMKQKIKISFWELNCWKCGTKQHVYFVSEELKSNCGRDIYINDSLWDDTKFEYNPIILKAVNEIINSKNGKKIKLGKIERRYSHKAGKSYMSFGCIKCNAIFGDFPLMETRIEIESEESNKDIVFVKDIELQKPIIVEKNPHWCFSETKEFCE